MSFSCSHAQSVLITLSLQRIDCALRSSLGVSNTAQAPLMWSQHHTQPPVNLKPTQKRF